MDNPLGIDTQHPRLSWQKTAAQRGAGQTAYEISVATSVNSLVSGDPDIWSSGRITSSQSVDVPYAGPALTSEARYYWSVRVWDNQGRPSTPVKAAWWEMGLLSPTDWQGKWIADDPEEYRADRASGLTWIKAASEGTPTAQKKELSQFRLDFSLSGQPFQATLYITAEPTVAAWMNGTPVLATSPVGTQGPFYP